MAARWVSRFVPSILPEANPNTCAPYAWAHLKIGQRADLRAGYAALLKERVARNAPPVKITPPRVRDQASSAMIPIESGCLLCGVGTQSVPATQVAREGREYVARDLWTAKRTGTFELGGQRSPQQLSGWLCARCADACSSVGAMGPTALERALVMAVAPQGLGILPYGNLAVPGLIGWGALCAEAHRRGEVPPEPNRTGWAHLPDLDALANRLRSALGVS
jgi:hypothetical protein